MKIIEKATLKKKVSEAFGKKIYLLGQDNEGAFVWLEAPKWECGWYWGFGYIERYTNNRNPSLSRDIQSHTHWDSEIIGKHEYYDSEKGCFRMSSDYIHTFNDNPNFKATVLSEKENWTLAELMQSFYRLKETANILAKGSAHVTDNPCSEVIKNEAEAKRINEVVLPAIFSAIDKLLTPEQ